MIVNLFYIKPKINKSIESIILYDHLLNHLSKVMNSDEQF